MRSHGSQTGAWNLTQAVGSQCRAEPERTDSKAGKGRAARRKQPPTARRGVSGEEPQMDDLENLAWLDAGRQDEADFAAGEDKAASGQPFEACQNRYERDGWLACQRQKDLAVDEAQYTPRPGFDF